MKIPGRRLLASVCAGARFVALGNMGLTAIQDACAGMVVFGITFQMMLDQASVVTPTLDMVEIFSGVGSIAAAARQAGYSAGTFDIEDSPSQDAMTRSGAEEAIRLVASVRANGLVWIAPECKTFCGLCSMQTGRCSTRPEGYASNPKVEAGNVMAVCLGLCPELLPRSREPAVKLVLEFWASPEHHVEVANHQGHL